MENHALFPVLISKFQYDKNDVVKDTLLCQESIGKYFRDGITCEPIYNSLHHEEKLTDLYKFVSKSVKEYLDVCNVKTELFDVMVHKSWLNVGKDSGNPRHNHMDSHMSFVYYVHTPYKNSIRFFADKNVYEPYDNFYTNYVKENQWNVFNSRSWTFPPNDGVLFVFPAALSHEVDGPLGNKFVVNSVNDLLQCRIAIAGDVMIVAKEVIKETYRVVQPYNFWRKFDE